MKGGKWAESVPGEFSLFCLGKRTTEYGEPVDLTYLDLVRCCPHFLLRVLDWEAYHNNRGTNIALSTFSPILFCEFQIGRRIMFWGRECFPLPYDVFLSMAVISF